MSQEFTKGQTVYGTDGRSAIYVARVDDGHIVQPLYEDGGGMDEPPFFYAEGADLWPTAHANPPREVLHAEIATLERRIAALRQEAQELQRAQHEAARTQREVMERLKQHEALRYLDDFLNAQITHYVTDVEGQTVVMDSKAFNESRTFGYSERVLALFARTREGKTALEWQIKAPNDLGAREIWAFPDEDKARAQAALVMTEKMQAALRDLKQGHAWKLDSVLKNAAALRVEPLPELMAAKREHEIREATAAHTKAAEAAAAAQQKLQALGAA